MATVDRKTEVTMTTIHYAKQCDFCGRQSDWLAYVTLERGTEAAGWRRVPDARYTLDACPDCAAGPAGNPPEATGSEKGGNVP